MADKKNKQKNDYYDINNHQKEPLFFTESFKREVDEITVTNSLYKKTQKRIEEFNNTEQPILKKKRSYSFYFSIVASAACIILVGVLILSHSGLFHMGSRYETDSMPYYDSSVFENNDPSFIDAEAMISEWGNEHFVSFSNHEQALQFYNDRHDGVVFDDEDHSQERPLIQGEEPGLDFECTSKDHAFRFLQGSLFARSPINSALNPENHILAIARNNRILLIDASDDNALLQLSSIEMSFSDYHQDAYCLSYDLVFEGHYLWVIYSCSNQSVEQFTLPDEYFPHQYTRVEVYDLTDLSDPHIIHSFEVDGRYLAAETNNDAIIVITEKYIAHDDFSSDQVLPHSRYESGAWEVFDASQLLHIRPLPIDAFVSVSYWSLDSLSPPKTIAISGSFQFFHFDENILILIGSSDSLTLTVYAQWDQDYIYIGTEQGRPSIILS